MKNYCMSAYLTFRYIENECHNFFPGLTHSVFKPARPQYLCDTGEELDVAMQRIFNPPNFTEGCAVFLSGGIDSAIVASYLPKGTKAYTFKCVADGAIDETQQAALYAQHYELDHEIIEIYWDDFELLTPDLLRFNKVPFHSIEVQLYKAARLARRQGIKKIFIGESADLIYGGMDKLLAKDWGFDEFVERYTFLNPSQVLYSPVSQIDVYERYRINERIDLLRFMNEVFSIESSTSYMHAFGCAGVEYFDPFACTAMRSPLDLKRVRAGEPKYIVQELFKKRFPGLEPPVKIPMPRAMDQWLKDWQGPVRPEFKPNCVVNLTGDQRWQVYCLERFLDLFEPLQ